MIYYEYGGCTCPEGQFCSGIWGDYDWNRGGSDFWRPRAGRCVTPGVVIYNSTNVPGLGVMKHITNFNGSSWWDAYNLCKMLGKSMVTASDFNNYINPAWGYSCDGSEDDMWYTSSGYSYGESPYSNDFAAYTCGDGEFYSISRTRESPGQGFTSRILLCK